MGKPLVQTGQFRGIRKQPLHNVLVYAPTLIWVNQGHKQLWWHDTALDFTQSDWLAIPASQYLTFVNVPDQILFHSRTLTFLESPPQAWVEESVQSALSDEPRIHVTQPLAYCFDVMTDMVANALSEETQRQFLMGFYAELKQAGVLHLLFPGEGQSLREKLSRYLSVNPGDDHKIEVVSGHLSMSRATMNRKLAAEGTSFRQVLAEVRMGYALSLIQESRSQLDVALACGYQSEARFSSRFKQQFGLTPKQYVQTL
ncbi:helix-turn-helix transcriptional regulator [Parasalinivibrio latis]|uniref:helix-turn-helix transcriptional regulator n=1 Tax=Parasalinivibrio latis TaxID=2952610 RepID=UPI0030E1D85C